MYFSFSVLFYSAYSIEWMKEMERRKHDDEERGNIYIKPLMVKQRSRELKFMVMSMMIGREGMMRSKFKVNKKFFLWKVNRL